MRNGNFSSSSIWKLTRRATNKKDFGLPALTYIAEKKMEIRLGRQLNSEVHSHPTSWGNLVEPRPFGMLGTEYQLVSKDRLAHPYISNWTGAPDLIAPTKVSDIKCCFTLKAFCEMVDAFGNIEALKKAAEEYYWQLVSNSILTQKKNAELIVYVPYKKELQAIRNSIDDIEGDTSEFNWIKYTNDNQLPFLLEGGHYKNLNSFEFEVPEIDKEFLTESVQMAILKLHE